MKTFNFEKLSENISNLMERIKIVAENSGRRFDDIRIVPATKYVDINVCEAMISLGFTELGENRIQELERKAEVLPDFKGWHFFGHLQKNKVRKALKHCKIIETVDSSALAERIAFIAKDEGIENVGLFIEVKTSEENSKTGADANEVAAIINVIQKNPVLGLKGLMTMAALGDAEHSKKYFKELYEYRNVLQNEF
ncbi:MAG: alanine racemase, partial [Candidatus Heimdallarchaeota archaeon]|nr:alanine racemase [Candidatus Heimdallarchaeota archaeon]